MEQIFARMHELLEDSCNIESALVSALTESQGTDPPNHRSPPSSSSLTLHLAAYVCFFYYHLAWDYVSTGFQLDLYSCHEWVYMYSFEINIFRSLTSLLQHIITPWLQETEGGADGKSGTEAINNQNTSNAVAKRSGRRRRRKAHEETHESAQVATDGVSPSLLVELDACAVGLDYWKYQVFEYCSLYSHIFTRSPPCVLCDLRPISSSGFPTFIGVSMHAKSHDACHFTTHETDAD
ncbi:N-alpha-acetyltransferase 35 NatC auxiliary subunit [Sparganum proliferum]